MSKFNRFFSALVGKKKDKGDKSPSTTDDYNKKLKTFQVRLETNESKSTSLSVPVPFGIPGNSRCKVKVMDHESPVKEGAIEVAYEGEDELESDLSIKRDNSDIDLQSHVIDSNSDTNQPVIKNEDFFDTQYGDKPDKDDEEGVGLIQSGNVSDPGIWKAEFWALPELKRSCSDLETREVFRKISYQLPPSKSESFEELQQLADRFREEAPKKSGSPKSVLSHCSADKVMLKKHSSSQVLPSRSRRLWWKLFLWSHRNLQPRRSLKAQTVSVTSAFNQEGGYCSDILEPNGVLELDAVESPENEDNQNWNGFHAGFLPQNQWVAFSTESPLTRVDEWVKELATQPVHDDEEKDNESGVVFPPSPENGKSLSRNTSQLTRRQNLNLPEEILQANNVIRSLNSSSTVAHAMGIGLKVIPTLAQFSSLRSVNLSGNSIVHITSGSLPKGLHSLNLSRNKISTIEGFRELTRLRVLDLSYNRISRIGRGLSNCTLIKELYLAGNKISEVEGLHRLLKLTVLDLSFNKITTAKALGQLVANYNSLLALNLLGNPIQSNTSDEQLRKAACSLLPKLAYLNKQPINPHKAREVATESIAKAALGNGSRVSHRKTVKRVSQGGSVSSSLHRGEASATLGQKTKHRSNSRSHYYSDLNMKSAQVASSLAI